MLAKPPKYNASIYSPDTFVEGQTFNVESGVVSGNLKVGSLTATGLVSTSHLSSGSAGISGNLSVGGSTSVAGVVTGSNLTSTNAEDIAALQGVLNPDLPSAPNVPSSIWDNSLVAYYDFADENSLAFDCGPNACHGTNSGCRPSNSAQSGTRTKSVWIDKQPVLDYNIAHANENILDLSPAALRMNLSSFTISCWARRVGPTSTTQTFVSCGRKLTTSSPANAPCIAFLCNNSVFLVRATGVDGTVLFRVDTQSNIPSGTWVHMVVTVTPSGNSVYFNGVLQTVYHTGSNAIGYDMNSAPLVPDHLLCGATWENHTLTPHTPKYKWGANCNLSDLSIWNRALSQAEVSALYSDNYGYSVIAIAGQSNAVGFNTLRAGVDDDYSKITGRVFQYETNTNIDAVTMAVLGNVVSAATHPLKWPSPLGGEGVSMWGGLCDKICTEMRLPFRRKILLLPLAKGSTGFANGDWRVGAPRYNNSVVALNQVLDPTVDVLNRLNHLTAFLWSQGERDMANLNLTYKADWYAMYGGFQAEVPRFGLPATILCHVGGDYDQYTSGSISLKAKINAELADIANENPSHMRLNEFGKTWRLFSGTNHYDAEGIRLQGESVFRNLADLWNYQLTTASEAVVVNQMRNSSPDSRTVFVNLPMVAKAIDSEQETTKSLRVTGDTWQNTLFVDGGGDVVLDDRAIPSAVHVRTAAVTVILPLRDDSTTMGRRVRIFCTSVIAVTIGSQYGVSAWGLVGPGGDVLTTYEFTGPGYVDCVDLPSSQFGASAVARRWLVMQPVVRGRFTSDHKIVNSNLSPTEWGLSRIYQLSGSTARTVTLPDIAGVENSGVEITFLNLSSANLTVTSANLLMSEYGSFPTSLIVPPNSSMRVTVSNGVWVVISRYSNP